MEVIGVTSYGDLSSFAQQQSRARAFILSIDDEELGVSTPEEAAETVEQLRKFVTEIRFRNADIPIFLYGETRTSRHIPNDVLRELHGFIHMFEDTPEFVARYIVREAKTYEEGRPVAMPRPFPHVRLQLLTEGTEAPRPAHGELHLLWQDLAQPGDERAWGETDRDIVLRPSHPGSDARQGARAARCAATRRS